MSFKVLVIPEDPTFNGYILKPLVEAVLAEAGKPKAKVQMLSKPKVGGFDQARHAIKEILPDSYGHWDLWVFIPDADRATAAAMRDLEEGALARGIRLLCCPAQPEVEIYCCVGRRKDLNAPSWEAVRSSARMKEAYFEPLLRKHGEMNRAGGGRESLIAASLSKMETLFRLCPELAALRDRMREITP